MIVKILNPCRPRSLVRPRSSISVFVGEQETKKLECQIGSDQKVDEDISVICTWYRLNGQTHKSEKKINNMNN
jgi:hypothetical protein